MSKFWEEVNDRATATFWYYFAFALGMIITRDVQLAFVATIGFVYMDLYITHRRIARHLKLE